MYSKIVNPHNNKKVSTKSKLGKSILKKYIQALIYMRGGASGTPSATRVATPVAVPWPPRHLTRAAVTAAFPTAFPVATRVATPAPFATRVATPAPFATRVATPTPVATRVATPTPTAFATPPHHPGAETKYALDKPHEDGIYEARHRANNLENSSYSYDIEYLKYLKSMAEELERPITVPRMT